MEKNDRQEVLPTVSDSEKEEIIGGAKNQIFWLHNRRMQIPANQKAQHNIIIGEINRINRLVANLGGSQIDPETVGEELLEASRNQSLVGWINGRQTKKGKNS